MLFSVLGDICDPRTVERRLQERYKDEIKFVSKPGGVKIIVFVDSEYTALCKSWRDEKKNPEEEDMKALRVAASIIRNDNNLCT